MEVYSYAGTPIEEKFFSSKKKMQEYYKDLKDSFMVYVYEIGELYALREEDILSNKRKSKEMI